MEHHSHNETGTITRRTSHGATELMVTGSWPRELVNTIPDSGRRSLAEIKAKRLQTTRENCSGIFFLWSFNQLAGQITFDKLFMENPPQHAGSPAMSRGTIAGHHLGVRRSF